MPLPPGEERARDEGPGPALEPVQPPHDSGPHERRERPPQARGSLADGSPVPLDPDDDAEDGGPGDGPVGALGVVASKEQAVRRAPDDAVDDEAGPPGILGGDDGAHRQGAPFGRRQGDDVAAPERGVHARAPDRERDRDSARRQVAEERGGLDAREGDRPPARENRGLRTRRHGRDASTGCDSLSPMPTGSQRPRSIGAPAARLTLTREVDWVLARAFDRREGGSPGPFDGSAAMSIAGRLGLLPRIVHRLGPARLASEVGPSAATEALDEYRQSALVSARLVALARFVGHVAAGSGIRVVALKHAALCLSGVCGPAERGAADADVLVSDADAPRLRSELVRAGVRVSGAPAYDHQHSPLFHPQAGMLELHRTIPGVRPSRDEPETSLESLVARGLAAPLDASEPHLLVPRPHVLLAHALAHALYQHGLEPGAYPPLKLLADIADLRRFAGDGLLSEALPLVAAEVNDDDAKAAWALPTALGTRGAAAALARGETPEARLLAHFVLGALDPDYRDSLKLRSAWTLPSDRNGVAGLLRWAWHTVAISRAQAQALYGAETRPTYALALARRPFHLAWKLVRYVRAAARGGEGRS